MYSIHVYVYKGYVLSVLLSFRTVYITCWYKHMNDDAAS